MQWEGVLGRELRVGRTLMPGVLRLNQLDVSVRRRRGGRGWENQIKGRRCRKEGCGAGLERILQMRMNNLGSILEENISVQS